MKFHVITLSILFPVLIAQRCPPGSVTSNATNSPTDCVKCPRGTYQDGPLCTECPVGTFNAFPGAQGPDLCRRCPAGTFSRRTGRFGLGACRPCPTGRISGEGASQCVRCLPGTFFNSFSSSCVPCTNGFVSVEANQRQCTRCPGGTIVSEGSSSCMRCPPGQQPDSGNTECQTCIRFSYNDGTLDRCTRCPRGLRGNRRLGATRCIGCPPGRANGIFDDACQTVCAPGENTVATRPACVQDGTPCPSHHFEDSRGLCRTCSTLERYDPSRKACRACPPGSRSTGNLDTRCVPCPSGRELVGDRCRCPEGFTGPDDVGECTICPPGTSWITNRVCSICRQGTFSSFEGSVRVCTPCPRDEVQPLSGQSSCMKCPEGLIASTLFNRDYPSTARVISPRDTFLEEFSRTPTRSVCVSPETNCPPNQERITNRAGQFFCQPTACPAGTREVMARPFRFRRMARFCVRCPVSTRFDEASGRCVDCRFNEISDGGLTTECVPCPRNMRRRILPDGTQECICSTESFGMNPRSLTLTDDGRCVRCPRGTFGIVESTVCEPCPAGTIERFNGCFTCDAGTFSVAGSTSSRTTLQLGCTPCPEGTTSYGLGDPTCVPIGGA